ncbi:MAG: TolC family protein [Saprospiraceae bacterium]
MTLDKAIELTVAKNKVNNKIPLLLQSSNNEIEKYKKQNLPTVTWNTQFSIQSENISLDLPIPGIDPIDLPLYKAQSTLDANYVVYDGGVSKTLIENEKIKAKISEQSINVQLYNLKDKVVEIYYNIILADRQKEVLDSSLSILHTKKEVMNSMYSNGVIMKSDIDKIDIEIIKTEQNIANIISGKKTLLNVLSNLTGIEENTIVVNEPEAIGNIDNTDWTNRPELNLFELKNELLDHSNKIIDLKNKPKVALFAKAGVGYPNPLNFFDTSFSPFAIGGVNVIWNIWDWKRTKIDKQKIQIEKDLVDNDKDIFDENIKLESDKLASQISGLKENAKFDNKIIENQKQIITTVENQYKNGVATISDYLTELSKKNISEINKAIHDIELEKTQYKLNILLNK